MAVTSNINGSVAVNGVFVGNFHQNPALRYMSEAELLEQAPLFGGRTTSQILPAATTPWPYNAQDAVGGPRGDYVDPGDPDPNDPPDFWSPDYDPFGMESYAGDTPGGFQQVINTVTQPIIDTFPDWEKRGASMGMDYGSTGPHPSMCKLALMNKALIAIVQAGAVTSAGNPLLGVVGSILSNGLRRLGVGADWGKRIFGSSQDASTCQRIVEEAIAVGYLRIPKPNADGSLPANMRITLDPDSPRATLQWGRKTVARRTTPIRRAAPRRRTYRKRS